MPPPRRQPTAWQPSERDVLFRAPVGTVLSLVLMADYSFDGPESSTMGELTAIVNDQETVRRLYER